MSNIDMEASAVERTRISTPQTPRMEFVACTINCKGRQSHQGTITEAPSRGKYSRTPSLYYSQPALKPAPLQRRYKLEIASR